MSVDNSRTSHHFVDMPSDSEAYSPLTTPPHRRLTCTQKTIFVSSRIFAAVLLGTTTGAAVGALGGLGAGIGFDWFWQTWFPPINPEFSIAVAKIGLCTGAFVHGGKALLKGTIHAFDYQLSWRKYIAQVG